jgi:hypothetical protein
VDYATRKYILIMDCHVLLKKGAIDALMNYYKENPNCKNIIQGPLLINKLDRAYTHFVPQWSGDMYGTWGNNQSKFEKGEPFEIEMQGTGCLSFEKSAWKGIPKHFRGFGGEAGYIHKKFRQWGGKAICLPQFQWLHRFDRPSGVPYKLSLDDRIFNYFFGAFDLGDTEYVKSIENYFKQRKDITRIKNDAFKLSELCKAM